ncbi:MAG TPA: hypothetical protein VFL14_13870, partial [Xanthomonadales bacterium]|nr:hypothetical protein [Xanthomonadales bacterium]
MSYRNSPNGDLAAALRALPLAAPAQSAWPRLADAFAARQKRRRQARFAIPLAAAALLALAFGLARLQVATPPQAPATLATNEAPHGGTAALIARNQGLQAMLRGFDSRNA